MSKFAASEIGRQIRDARKRQEISVVQAAKTLNVKRQMIYNYENGKCLPALDVLIKAANAWGTTFWLGGCEVVPRDSGRRKPQRPEPVQQVFPFNRRREYKKSSIEVRQADGDLIIIARLRAER